MRLPNQIEIVSAVVHDVPRPGDPEQPILTDRPVRLDAQLEKYFEEKLLGSLESRGVAVSADSDGAPVVREGVARILRNARSHVTASQEMARHLYELQKQTNSPGLLTVLRARAGDDPVVAVLKLEREVGVHVQIERVGDQQVIDLEYLRDLTLTRKTRVFKAAVLGVDGDHDPLSMSGLASDDQRSQRESRGVARFFLHDFLGCQLRDSPEKATQDFWNGAQVFIEEDVAAPERKGRYQVALQAYLERPEHDIRPETFIGQSVEDADKPRLRQRLRDEGVEPRQGFPKDLVLIERKIQGFRITFDHGMTLLGSREDMEERLELEHSRDADPATVIKDELKSLRGR